MVGIAFLLLLSVQFVSGLNCATGWLGFLGRCYSFQKTPRTWQRALDFCIDNKAHLVDIDTITLQVWLRDQMKNLSISRMWTGATSVFTKGEVVWTPSGRPLMPYSNWRFGVEMHYRGENDCAYLDPSARYTWMGDTCNNKSAYICMKPQVGEGCEEGFEVFKEKCYSFNWDFVPWQSAVERCYYRGADLLELDNKELDEWVTKKLKKLLWTASTWIGATNQYTNGEWSWLTTHRPLKPFTRWSYRELFKGAGNIFSGGVVMNGEIYGDWETENHDQRHPFVCQGIGL